MEFLAIYYLGPLQEKPPEVKVDSRCVKNKTKLLKHVIGQM